MSMTGTEHGSGAAPDRENQHIGFRRGRSLFLDWGLVSPLVLSRANSSSIWKDTAAKSIGRLREPPGKHRPERITYVECPFCRCRRFCLCWEVWLAALIGRGLPQVSSLRNQHFRQSVSLGLLWSVKYPSRVKSLRAALRKEPSRIGYVVKYTCSLEHSAY